VKYSEEMSSSSVEQNSIDHRYLRSAIEFAVEVARMGQKNRPPLKFPAEIKPMFRQQRIPAGALGKLRRAIEAAPEFRRALGVAATMELVDQVGLLWLTQPEDWESEAQRLIEELKQAASTGRQENELRKEQRRREAAEQALIRTRAEMAVALAKVVELEAEVAELGESRTEIDAEVEHLRAEVRSARTEARHERDRAAAARAEAARLRADLGREQGRRNEVESVRDQALAGRTERALEAQRLRMALDVARQLVDQLTVLAGDSSGDTGATRTRSAESLRVPLSLPGGVVGDSDLATDHLLRSGALIIVDGYNVAKLLWPTEQLIDQRERLIAVVEAAAQRSGSEILITFDGADVVGAHTSRRRLIRVIYSAEGAIADDLIRNEVKRTPVDRAVVVVTNDAEVIRDVRSMGANTVSSERFAKWCRG
jgi:predicted RNA-binding protein with PIN domain